MIMSSPSPGAFFVDPPFPSLTSPKTYQNNSILFQRFYGAPICNFIISVVVSQIAQAHIIIYAKIQQMTQK